MLARQQGILTRLTRTTHYAIQKSRQENERQDRHANTGRGSADLMWAPRLDLQSVLAMSASQLRLHDATTSSENGGRGQMGWARHRYHASDRKSVAVFFLVCALPLQLLGRVHVRPCASCSSARVCADVIE